MQMPKILEKVLNKIRNLLNLLENKIGDKIRLTSAYVSLTFIILGIIAYLIGIRFLDIMELKTIDLRFNSRGAISQNDKIVLAVVDEKSIAKEGKWIWPRVKFAKLVSKLSELGAKVIAFDIGFLESDETDSKIIDTLKDLQNKTKELGIQNQKLFDYIEKSKSQASNDEVFARAIQNSKAKIILGYFFQMESAIAKHVSKDEIMAHKDNIIGSKYKVAHFTNAKIDDVKLEAFFPQSNIKILSNTTKYSGYFNMIPDPDGVVRWIPGVIKFAEEPYVPLALMSVSAFLDSQLMLKISDFGVEEIKIGNDSIPVDEYGRIFINYRGEQMTFPHISITDILQDQVKSDVIRDKIVMIGATAIGIYDMRVTPFGSVFPGLEVHANVADSILSNNFIYRPSWTAYFDIFAIMFLGILLGIVLPKLGALMGAGLWLFLFFGYILLCQFLFSQKGIVLNVVYPLSVMILVYLIITAEKYFTESRQKSFIRNAFASYLAPTIVENLIKNPERLKLGGERRVITAFFSDVQGFTTISEKLSPEALVELLNEFLTEMTDIILKHKGTVDKFEGDAIIAFFGAPMDLDNQEDRACTACVEMQKRLVELRKNWAKRDKPQLKMRIGLCTGPAVVGNMGSKQRMDYTMMGDTVNTAARLEGVNKIYGTYVLISESTCKNLSAEITTRELDFISVVGKKDPIRIYQVVGYTDEENQQVQNMISFYKKGLYAYRSKKWDEAINFFDRALELDPFDGPSKTMLLRCKELKLTPPDSNWDGVYTMKTK